MKTRLLKVLSVPIAIFILMIPAIIIQSVIWIINGRKSPMKMIENYAEWLEK